MNLSFRLLAFLTMSGALVMSGGAALAQAGGGPGTRMPPLPSQRITQNSPPKGGGAGLVISASGVREIQQELHRLGYSSGPINGKWDAQTQRAMRHFQAAHDLTPDGDLTLSAVVATGMWPKLLGSPTGTGHQSGLAQNTSGTPPVRGHTGGESATTGSSGKG